MQNDWRFQRVNRGVWGVAIVVLAVAVLYAWSSNDTSAPDDSQFVHPGQPVLRQADNAFLKLRSLSESIEQLGLADHGTNTRRLPASYDDGDRAAADNILRLELVQRLPASLAELLEAPAFRSTAEPGVEPLAGRGTLDIARLLRLQMQRQLYLGDREGAWRTAQLALRFGQVLHDRTQTFYELSLAQTCQSLWLKAVLAGIDADQWSVTQLRALVSLPEPMVVPQRLMQGLRREYTSFVHGAAQNGAGASVLLRGLLYHPHRTRRAWLSAMAVPIAALDAGDVVRAHQALENAEAVAALQTPLVRNALGHRLLVTSIAGTATPVAQAVDATAQVRLIKLRSAIELYRLEQGHWPENLQDLVGTSISALPLDPWSIPQQSFRYSVPDRTLYSIGVNHRDDHGRFNNDLSRNDSDDYGLRLPDLSRRGGGSRI
jgi:hypothetical protein